MPVNVPSFTTNNFSFGPGRLFLGAAGTTPSVDVGAIGEGGIGVTLMSKKRGITQGNPKIEVYAFSQEQGVTLKLESIEWNVTNLMYALGSGNTTSSGTADTLVFGGDPLVDTCALYVQHYMAAPADTLDGYIWKARGEGDVEISFTHDEHKFPYQWTAQRVTTNWGGETLAFDEQLIKINRIK